MNKARFKWWKLAALCAVLALTLAPGVSRWTATGPPAFASDFTDVDLSVESRILDAFIKDLVAFDKRATQFNKRDTLNHDEFNSLQRNGDDLKARVSGVQDAFRDAIRKLKAANKWDDLDATVLAQITDPRIRIQYQQNSFKAELEAAASNLSDGATEIFKPLDALRNKISTRQEFLYEQRSPQSELRIVRASYAPLTVGGFRCRLAWLGFGIKSALGKKPSPSSINCFCYTDCGQLSDLQG